MMGSDELFGRLTGDAFRLKNAEIDFLMVSLRLI